MVNSACVREPEWDPGSGSCRSRDCSAPSGRPGPCSGASPSSAADKGAGSPAKAVPQATPHAPARAGAETAAAGEKAAAEKEAKPRPETAAETGAFNTEGPCPGAWQACSQGAAPICSRAYSFRAADAKPPAPPPASQAQAGAGA
jgi:hypothetical protein